MAQIPVNQMRDLVADLASRSRVGAALQRVEIDHGGDDDLDGTVRIVIRLKDLNKAEITDLRQLLSEVEDTLSGQDDRYPSVRFAEAA